MKTYFQVSLDVEITLTKRFLPIFSHIGPEYVNEANLIDAAFRPKVYKVELAKGRFDIPDWLHWERKPSSPPQDDPEIWFGLRVVFDKSPYPMEYRGGQLRRLSSASSETVIRTRRSLFIEDRMRKPG